MVDLTSANLNDYERSSSAIVKVIDGQLGVSLRGAPEYLQDGDFILLGRTTENALLGTPILMLDEDFPVGATLDFGYVTYDAAGPIGIDPVHLDVPLNSGDISTGAKMVRLPWTSKQVNPDGSEYTGEDGILWGGTALGCIYHGGTATVGTVKIIIPSTSFSSVSPGTYLTRGA